MTAPHFRSSGDLTADRRYSYAIGLLEAGEAIAAGDLIEQALELAPDWPVGWFTLAQARDGSGDFARAVAAFERAARLDPDDALGARLHLARIGATPTPAQPPAAYVRGLFDDYADRFDHALVDGLAYRAPQLIAAALARTNGARIFKYGLDLGCGTGLMAQEIRRSVVDLTGIDLSARMVDAAQAKNLYDGLQVSDIIDAMRALPDQQCDLITAADVFCYLGDLEPVISQAARLLPPGGNLAFSVESALQSVIGDDYILADSLRFRHSATYIARILAGVGLAIEHFERETLRNDRGVPIEGFIVVATKPPEIALSER